MPWGYGKEQMTTSYKVYLARWARRLSWKETADIFKTSWESVYRAVQHVVEYGLANRNLDGITEIGVDEIKVFMGHKYMTMVYQLNAGTRRLLWCGQEHGPKPCSGSFVNLAKSVAKNLRYVCSDMWVPYLKVITKKAPNALNILDRFHIMKKFNEAIDQIRRARSGYPSPRNQENVLQKVAGCF